MSYAKDFLDTKFEDHENEIGRGAVCVVSLVAALESVVNILLKSNATFRHYDELRLASKIETIFDIGNEEFSWGEEPLQSIGELIRTRNWLVHFKEREIGLAGSEGYAKDYLNRLPKIDPDVFLKANYIRRQYKSVITLSVNLAKIVGCEDLVKHIQNESFDLFISY